MHTTTRGTPRLLLGALLILTFAPHASASGDGQKGVYGSAIGGDALSNATVGGPVGARKHFLRFRATQTSTLVAVTFPFLSADYPGYGGGTGGAWTLTLYPDDGTPDHFPASTPLASRKLTPSVVSDIDRDISFSPAPMLLEGALYHLVFENSDPNPTVNYFSVNSWARLSFEEQGSLNPLFSSVDWAAGAFYAGAWHNQPNSCPIASLAYGNGRYQGMSYGEASYTCPNGGDPCVEAQLVGQIGGPSKKVRQRFTVTCRDRLALGFGVRLLKVPGTTSNLVVSLRDEDDQVLESVVVPAFAVANGPAPTYSFPPSWNDLGANARWVADRFADPHLLQEGKSYFLQLESSAGTYWAWVMRRLSDDFGYSPETAFADGWSEYTTDGVTWMSLGRTDYQNDLQFYMMTPCEADLNGDLKVDGADLSTLLGLWGSTCTCACSGDLDGNGIIGSGDLATLLGFWGPCP